MTTPGRLMRLCDVCGGYDDYPRHVQAVLPGTEGTVPDQAFLAALPDGCSATSVAELMDPTTFCRHMDCCANAGCQECADVIAANGGATGAALLTALTGGN